MSDMVIEISEKYANQKFSSFSPEVVDTTKKFILDTIGCGIAGTNAPGSKEVHSLFKSFEGKKEASLIGLDDQLPCPDAAFVNSVASHALDFDDTLDDAAMHCYVNVLPAALALAEAKSVGGKGLITGVALGIDLCCRLGVSINTPLSWIRTATCGSFGATVAAAKVCELDKEGIHNALGIVYSQTAGNAQCLIDGGLAKRMQPGFSARAGVLSALMANLGITGAKEVFEGKFGFFNLYERGSYLREKCLENLGEEFYGMKLSIKPYPSCRMTHSAIDAALAVKEKYDINFDDVEKVEVFVAKMSHEMVGKPFEIRQNPQVDAQFSIPYTVSVALAKGKPFIDDFKESNVCSESRKMATKKIFVLTDEEINETDIKPATIKVYLKNGNVVSEKINVLKGHPDNPLSWDEVIEKFKKCAMLGVTQYSHEKIDKLIQTVLALEDVQDTRKVLDCLR